MARMEFEFEIEEEENNERKKERSGEKLREGDRLEVKRASGEEKKK